MFNAMKFLRISKKYPLLSLNFAFIFHSNIYSLRIIMSIPKLRFVISALITLFIILFFSAFSCVFAQRKVPIADKNMGATVVISLPDVVYNCAYCKRLLSNFIGREKGVLSYVIDVKSKQAKIFFAPDLTNPELLRYAIANAGFQADTVKAEPHSRKLLPVCCRAKIDENWVKELKNQERERAKLQKKRYRPLRNFMCCELCDYYYKYAILHDSSIRTTLKRR